MIFVNALKAYCIVLVGLTLTACTAIESQRKGPSVDVFPVMHTLLLNSKDNSFERSKELIIKNVEENNSLLVTHSVALNWSGETSKRLAEFAKQHLLSLGASSSNIKMTPSISDTGTHFDFEMKVLQYKVNTKICEVAKNHNFYTFDDGCYTESARWRSMVAPERMLPNHLQGQE